MSCQCPIHPLHCTQPPSYLLPPSLAFAYLRAICDPVATVVVAVPSLPLSWQKSLPFPFSPRLFKDPPLAPQC